MSPSRDRQHTVHAHGQQQVTCNDRAHAHGQQHITCTYRPCVRMVSNTVHPAMFQKVSINHAKNATVLFPWLFSMPIIFSSCQLSAFPNSSEKVIQDNSNK